VAKGINFLLESNNISSRTRHGIDVAEIFLGGKYKGELIRFTIRENQLSDILSTVMRHTPFIPA